jgi:hypothetical protein
MVRGAQIPRWEAARAAARVVLLKAPMRVRSPLLLALGASLWLACGSGDASAPDGEDVASAQTITGGAARTRGFVVPNLSPAEEAQVLARYAYVDPQHTVAPKLLRDTLVYFSVNAARIPNKSHIAVVDFARPSGKQRFFLIDMASGQVAPHAVAHGAGSEDGHGNSTSFSNINDSHQSSLGFVLTGETYSGVHGRSLRLDGLSKTNSIMRPRAIVIHSAAYVRDGACRQGTSFGCFALDVTVKDTVVDALKDGALLYAGLGEPSADAGADAGAGAEPACTDPCLDGGCQQ